MTTYAITVIAQDRPGIIARVAAALAAEQLNLADSSMTVLRGQLAMTLICTGQAELERVRAAMTDAAADDLIIHVHLIDGAASVTGTGPSYLLTVHGADRLGIVATLTGVLAEAGGNISDLTTQLAGELYVLTAEVDLAVGTDLEALRTKINIAAGELGVEAQLQPVDQDEL
ncbi:glycine cleavage system protein R [Microlunatus soli]|uniref:Glycine cleavage system transcriptional repressor n=1 Tax=Microlunatus soli TaxID=630515 RepID=A0A1H1QX90_9ACTN|nr:ACT domain-containing protein [Microlunatus soli]SDS27499.1 glycine cleavage system transcriptional repressor [Microlunatus soli]